LSEETIARFSESKPIAATSNDAIGSIASVTESVSRCRCRRGRFGAARPDSSLADQEELSKDSPSPLALS
jgi:hypothetical protein